MIVGFYFENKNICNVDCRVICNGNPGIGGTEYMIWYISTMLSYRYKDLSVILYANSIDKLPPKLNTTIIEDELEAIKQAEKECDILVLRGPYILNENFNYLNSSKLKVISWCHNFEKYPWCELIGNNKAIVKNVCVGKEQLDRLRDTKLYKKSTYIFNTIQFELYSQSSRKQSHKVCYIGSLHKSKGFHKLAAIWPEVLKRVPDAELYVIGSGKLYNQNQNLGKFHIAEEKYESKFMKSLLNENGEIHSSVHFMDVMGGKEKIDFMKTMQVGIVNPLGVDETFCIGAVEFEAMGIPVVSVRKYALLDTVDDSKSGLLFSNKNEFVNNVVKLLTDNELNQSMGRYASSFVNNKFSSDSVIEQWHDLLIDVYYDKANVIDFRASNYTNNKKWLREVNRRLKTVFPFLPSVIWYENIPHELMEVVRKIKR